MPVELRFNSVASFAGGGCQSISVVNRLPWLYMIFGITNRVLYIGQTNDEGGLLARLGAHFGPFPRSSLRQRCADIAGVVSLKPPFITIATRLPSGDVAPFDCSSRELRLLCEALIHEHMVSAFPRHHGLWTLVSQPTPGKLTNHPRIEEAAKAIFIAHERAYAHSVHLSQTSPYQLIVIAQDSSVTNEGVSIGETLERLEVQLWSWVSATLRKQLQENWWTDGVPQKVRSSCVVRREEEGAYEAVPPEAYLMLIEIREIIRQNWLLFGPGMEFISERQGKDRATEWIVRVNDARKLWAHPLKQQYAGQSKVSLEEIIAYKSRLDYLLSK